MVRGKWLKCKSLKICAPTSSTGESLLQHQSPRKLAVFEQFNGGRTQELEGITGFYLLANFCLGRTGAYPR